MEDFCMICGEENCICDTLKEFEDDNKLLAEDLQ